MCAFVSACDLEHPHAREVVRGGCDTGVAIGGAVFHLPHGACGDVMDKSLAGKTSGGVKCRGREREVVVAERFVFRGATDLDHFETGRGFEHAVADAGRLKDTIALMHDEGCALIFVDDAHPALARAKIIWKRTR